MKSLIQTHLFPILSLAMVKILTGTIILEKDDFVIVEYEGRHFTGKIVQVVADGYQIAIMVKSSISSYRWPDKEDKLVYIREQIQKKICHPNLCSIM